LRLTSFPVKRSLAVHVERRRRGRAPGELGCAPESEITQLFPSRARGLDNRPGNGRRLPRVGQDRSAPRGFRHRAGVRRHDRAAAGHCLEDRQAEGLVQRRVDEHVRRSIEVDGPLKRHRAHEDHVVRDAKLCRQGAQRRRVLLVPPGADHGKLTITELAACQRPRLEQPVTVLVLP
jgi:hypothetical protein